MKGIHGLIVAIGLGVAGALFNFVYLNSRQRDDRPISFVGIAKGQTVNRGEILHDDQLVELKIPEGWAGNLKDFAELYDSKQGVIGKPVWRTLVGECLLLRDDLKTPPQELKLEEGEELWWFPVESRGFVPSLLSPGDEVMFLVPRLTSASPGKAPAPVAESEEKSATVAPLSAATAKIGPFRIRALGNRLGSAGVWVTNKLPQLQENVIGISVNAKNEKMAVTLRDILQATNYRELGILKLGPRRENDRPTGRP